jgi:hypothetical protein
MRRDYHLGIARSNRQRKIAFGTITRLVSMFAQPVAVADSRLSLSVSPPEAEVYRHAFVRQDGAQLLFVWTRQQSAVVSVTLPACGSRATEYGIDGTPAGRLDVTDCRLGSVALNAGQVRYFEIAQ